MSAQLAICDARNRTHFNLPGRMLLAMVVLLSCGCQFAPTWSQPKWPWSKKTPVMPDRILTVWSDSVLHQQGLPGVRGFGGRVYFYQAPSTDPIEVDGAVAVYVFDADQLNPKDQKPLRKYVFTADQMAEHMSKSSLGPSYSLWLPWDEVGGTSRRLSLITRFEGREGGTVISDPSIKLLPGVPKSTEDGSPSDQRDGSNVRVVGHQKHVREPVVTQEQIGGRGVETIDLPPSFQQHLRSGSQPGASQSGTMQSGTSQSGASQFGTAPSGNSNSSASSPTRTNGDWSWPPVNSPTNLSAPGSPSTLDFNSPSTTTLDSSPTGLVTGVHDVRSGNTRSKTDPKRNIREGKSIQSPR